MSRKAERCIEAFLASIREIESLAPQLAALGIEGAALVDASKQAGNYDMALTNGVACYGALHAEANRLFGNFEDAASKLLGTRPKEGEGHLEFFVRTLNLGYDGWRSLAKHNGTPF